MARQSLPLNSFIGVAASSTAQTTLPANMRIHGLNLHYTTTQGGTGGTAANILAAGGITAIRVSFGGSLLIKTFTPLELFIVNAYRGRAFTTFTDQAGTVWGEIFIPFSSWWARTPDGEESTALETYDDRTPQILVEVVLGTNTAPALVGEVSFDNNRSDPKSTRYTLRQLVNAGLNFGAGEIDQPNRVTLNTAFQGIHAVVVVGSGTNTIDRVKVIRNGLQLIDRDLKTAAMLGRARGFAPQTSVQATTVVHFPIDFCDDGQVQSALPITSDFNLKVTGSTTGAGTLKLLTEELLKY